MTTTATKTSIPRAVRATASLALCGALLATGGGAYYLPAADQVTSSARASFDGSFSAACFGR